MKTMAICFAMGAVMGLARCASAAELPVQSVCNILSELAYDRAVADGDPLPDGAYERVQGSCEWSSDWGTNYDDALVAANAEGRYGVDQIEPGVWAPTTAAEDAEADRLSTDDTVVTCTNLGCFGDAVVPR